MSRFDERDIMFSRMELEEGSERYKEYYEKNPEKKNIDDEIRDYPPLMSEGTPTFDPLNSPMGVSAFNFLSDIKQNVDGEVRDNRVDMGPDEITEKLEGYAKYYGADLVGFTEIGENCYYSHRGRGENYGEKIDDLHDYAIAFAVEMDEDMINSAPRTSEAIEVTKGYVKAALIGMVLSYYVRELGYEARNHMDGNYLLIAPIVGEKAGIGEIGRSGILVTKEYGPRVRLGIVTTNLELRTNERQEFGLKKFCEECGKCGKACPGDAIPEEPLPENEDRWKIDQTKCYRTWRQFGTDCGVCLSNCPLSHGIEKELLDNLEKEKVQEKILERDKNKQYSEIYESEPKEWL